MARYLAGVIIVLCMITCVYAGDLYFPVEQGWSWSYVDETGDSATCEVVKSIIFHGNEVSVFYYALSSIVEYYSIDSSGNVLWHGLKNSWLSVHFDPPLISLKSNPTPGMSWVSSSIAYCDQGEGDVSQLEVEYPVEVLCSEEIDIPAGRFSALKVRREPVAVCASSHGETMMSFPAVEGSGQVTEERVINSYFWYVQGVGIGHVEVVGDINATRSLVSWTEPQVASESVQWGELKAWY